MTPSVEDSPRVVGRRFWNTVRDRGYLSISGGKGECMRPPHPGIPGGRGWKSAFLEKLSGDLRRWDTFFNNLPQGASRQVTEMCGRFREASCGQIVQIFWRRRNQDSQVNFFYFKILHRAKNSPCKAEWPKAAGVRPIPASLLWRTWIQRPNKGKISTGRGWGRGDVFKALHGVGVGEYLECPPKLKDVVLEEQSPPPLSPWGI